MLKRRLAGGIVLAPSCRGAPRGAPSERGRRRPAPATGTRRSTVHQKAVQENPDRPEYKIALERAMQTAAQKHISRAHELEAKDQLDAALIEYKRAIELDAHQPARRGTRRSSWNDRSATGSRRRVRSRAIDTLREQARRAAHAAAQPARRRCRSSTSDQLQRPRHPQLHRHSDRHQHHLRPGVPGQGLHGSISKTSRSSRRCSRSWRPISCSTRFSTRRPSSSSRTTRQKHAQYDELVVRVFYISHADVPELAQMVNTIMRIPTMPVQPTLVAEQDRQHDHRPRDGTGRRRHRADHPRQRQAAGRSRDRRADPRGQPEPRRSSSG